MELQRKVAEAIHVLNHDPESSNRVAANQWLVQFQQTPAAWDVSTSLLTSPIVSLFDLQFFAAQILRRKVSPFHLSISRDSQFQSQKPFLPPFCVGFSDSERSIESSINSQRRSSQRPSSRCQEIQLRRSSGIVPFCFSGENNDFGLCVL